jgi:hypothetical protein
MCLKESLEVVLWQNNYKTVFIPVENVMTLAGLGTLGLLGQILSIY